MIIGIDTSRANKTKRSGVEWYSYHLLKQLYKLDDKNHYFLYTPNKLIDDLKPLPKNFSEKILRWPLKKFWTQGRLSLEMIVNKPDLLFVPAHIFPIILGKKNVVSWPDVGHKHYPECYTKPHLKVIEHGLNRACQVADKIITISKFSKNELIKYYSIEPTKIAITYLGYDERLFYLREESEIQKIKEKYQIVGQYLIYVGRLAKRKNLENLIEAFNQLRQNYQPKISLALAGSQDFDFQSIDKKIKESPYQNSIKVLGYVPEEELPTLLSGAEALVHPSLFEGFGLTVLEAMACSCPVICSNSGSLPEIGQEAVEYFNPENPLEISQKILSVITDNKLRNQLIEKGKERVNDFSWEKCVRETLNILNNV